MERKPVTLRSDLHDRLDMLRELALPEATVDDLVDQAVEGFLFGVSQGLAEEEV